MKIEELKKDKQLDFWFSETERLTDAMQMKLYRYYELINEYNQHMNLTGIDDLLGVYLKHFYDSFTIDPLLSELKDKTIADLGSGAGFPGIILAVIFPEAKHYLIEPLTKRCKFLEVVVKELGLANVEVINKRAEDIEMRFDFVVSRAVARLNILLELATPLVKTGGKFIALKGPVANTEIVEAKNALNKLNVEIQLIDEVTLPIENSQRTNIVIYKYDDTPNGYPRNYGQIKKKPL
jgi:16S rRNA (guanine527-N7)-methyltransferase